MTDWGRTIRRIENAVTVCERCGGAVKIIACIQNPTVTAKIPEYVESSPQLKLPSARAPPAGSGLLVLVHPGTLWSLGGLPCFVPFFYASAIAHSAFRDQPRRR